jgi:hypothetical protein
MEQTITDQARYALAYQLDPATLGPDVRAEMTRLQAGHPATTQPLPATPATPAGPPQDRASGLRTAGRVAGQAVEIGVVIGYGILYTVLAVISAIVAFAAPGGMPWGLLCLAFFGWMAWRHWRQLIP